MYSPTVHVLQSIKTPNLMFGTHHRRCSYIVGFVESADGFYLSQQVSMHSEIDLGGHKALQSYKEVDTPEGKRILVLVDKTSVIRIKKGNNMDVQWSLRPIPYTDFFSFPIIRNLGLIMPTHQIDETKNEMIYEAYIMDPMRNPELFRMGLDMV